MKKMMIIAAMVSMMLIPAQMEAKNKVDNKAKIEYRNDKKDFDKKDNKKFKDDKKFKKEKDNKKKTEQTQRHDQDAGSTPCSSTTSQSG